MDSLSSLQLQISFLSWTANENFTFTSCQNLLKFRNNCLISLALKVVLKNVTNFNITVNHEYFVAKIFSNRLACVKIIKTHENYMRNNAVQGRLSENYLT